MDDVRMMAELHRQGYGYHTIARTLNERGVPTRTGFGRWHAKTVWQVMNAPRWASYQQSRRMRNRAPSR